MDWTTTHVAKHERRCRDRGAEIATGYPDG